MEREKRLAWLGCWTGVLVGCKGYAGGKAVGTGKVLYGKASCPLLVEQTAGQGLVGDLVKKAQLSQTRTLCEQTMSEGRVRAPKTGRQVWKRGEALTSCCLIK